MLVYIGANLVQRYLRCLRYQTAFLKLEKIITYWGLFRYKTALASVGAVFVLSAETESGSVGDGALDIPCQLKYCFVWNQENNIIFSEFNLCNNTVLSRDVEAPSPTARYVISGKILILRSYLAKMYRFFTFLWLYDIIIESKNVNLYSSNLKLRDSW